jgi:NADH-quinone oxidoreductase subunit N
LKRLLGYSSIAHAGYLLLGVAALNASGASAILYYLSGYLFTVVAAFAVIVLVTNQMEDGDIGTLAGLNQRSPLLATAMTISVVSLAGIPPMAGFVGKFLLFRSALEEGAMQPAFYGLVGVAVFGVVISLYYYFRVIQAIYWPREIRNTDAIDVPVPLKMMLWTCMAVILYLGVFPGVPLELAERAVAVFP